MAKPLTLLMFYLIAVSSLNGNDWPQWRGTNRDAVASETGLLQEWPESGPRLAWKVKGLGGGDSAPAISRGVLYGMSNRGMSNRGGKEIVWARNETNGNEIWAVSISDAVQQRMRQSQEGPACTPTVEEDQLYVIGMGGTVACLNTKDGSIVWQKSFVKDFGGSLPAWSYRESPLIDGDKLICTPGSNEALLVALDKNSGKTIWQTASSAPSPNRGSEPEKKKEPQRPRQTNNSTPRVAGTDTPRLFLSEHWGMSGYKHKIPNGKYEVRLYFAETYSGVRGEGERVFSFAVEDTEFKDFDIWKKAGGPRKAYIEKVPVEIADGELSISFTSQKNSPAIKAIEIVPDNKSEKTIRIKAGQTESFKDSKGNEWEPAKGFVGGRTSPGFFNFGSGRRSFGGGRSRGGRSGAAYSSVIKFDFEGTKQYAQLTANSLIGFSANDGKILWKYDAPANGMGINCSTPIFRDGLVFGASAYGNGGGAVKLSKTNDGKISTKEVYFSKNMQNHHGGMIVHDGCLYGANGGNGGGYLACLNFETGDLLWRDRKGPKGALAFANNRLYLRGERGEVLLIEPSKEKLIVKGRFDQPDRSSSPAWAHPVIANGKLYIRDQDLLLCYDIKAN